MSKPTLYIFIGSVWTKVPELAIQELGYTPDNLEVKSLNLVEGENFQPWFLKLNPGATLPTLIVGDKVYTDTKTVTEYLIKNASTTTTISGASALIDKVHEDGLDPNFALLAARNDVELAAKGAIIVNAYLGGRQKSLVANYAKPEAKGFENFYQNKIAANGGLKAIYDGQVPEEAKVSFFANSAKHWENIASFILNDLPTYLPESGFVGGNKPGEADFHLGAWLARIVAVVQGASAQDLANELKQPVPPKVLKYWAAWSSRDSWKKVYAEGLH